MFIIPMYVYEATDSHVNKIERIEIEQMIFLKINVPPINQSTILIITYADFIKLSLNLISKTGGGVVPSGKNLLVHFKKRVLLVLGNWIQNRNLFLAIKGQEIFFMLTSKIGS